MKLFENIKKGNNRTVKILGLPVVETVFDYSTEKRTQKFFGGIVTTLKEEDNSNLCSNKEIMVLGQPIIKCYEADYYRKYYLLGKSISKISMLNRFKKEYFKYFDKQHDDIYILRANSGEAYLTLTHIIDTLIKRNNSKTPLLVATQKYHVDMIKMICPDIPYIYIKGMSLHLLGGEFTIDNFRFFILYSIKHFKRLEDNIKNGHPGEHHYFKSILNTLKITNDDLGHRKVIVPPDDEQSMLNKIAKTGLNINNFVFLAPEAQSCKLYDEDFWVELINTLQDKGLDVFVNLVKDMNLEGANDFKTCDLTFAEAFALAKRAKKIVSLRSGFTEFLLQTDVPIDILYTKFKPRGNLGDMDIYHVISGFEINQLPFVDKSKIREFNMFEISPREYIKRNIEKFLIPKY